MFMEGYKYKLGEYLIEIILKLHLDNLYKKYALFFNQINSSWSSSINYTIHKTKGCSKDNTRD